MPSKVVEVTRVELVSKHILQKPSTCLFCFGLSGINWEQTTDQFLSWISLLLQSQPSVAASCFVFNWAEERATGLPSHSAIMTT